MKNRTWDYWLLWCVALGALAANVWLIRLLLGVRREAGQAAADAAQALGEFGAASLTIQVPIDHTLPVIMSIPLSQTVTVPISVSLPINTQVNARVPTFLGDIPVVVPINIVVPVRFEAEVPLSLEVPVSATIPIKLTVPVKLEVAGTPLAAALAEARVRLEALAEDWQSSFLP